MTIQHNIAAYINSNIATYININIATYINKQKVSLSKVFQTMTAKRHELGIRDWGIANTTLEEAFIKISRGAHSTD